MGLQRKQGEIIQEGQQFDIRSSVDEFKHYTSSYMFWKPGMEIFVSHVRRRQIPPFVFPEGHKRFRASRLSALQRSPNQEDVQNGRSGSCERDLKRKNDPARIEGEHNSPQKRQSISPRRQDSVSSNISNFSNTASSERPEADIEAKTIVEKNSPCRTITRENEELAFGGSRIGNCSSRKDSSSVESDKGSTVEIIDPDKVPFTEIDHRCASNSSVITSLTSESSSCENVGFALAAGSSEGNAGSIEGSADESNNPGTSVVDSCEADSELQLDNRCVNGDSMHMETEVGFHSFCWLYLV